MIRCIRREDVFPSVSNNSGFIEAQNGQRWAAEDEAIDRKLAEFREKNNGRPPNIFYILIDDIGSAISAARCSTPSGDTDQLFVSLQFGS